MSSSVNIKIPKVVEAILAETTAINFQMVSDLHVGSLLKTLAMSKPSGRFLELGTGTGVSTAWILAGMDARSTLLTVDNDRELVSIAQKYLGHDSRVKFFVEDGGSFIDRLVLDGEKFDSIFADTWAGKYTHLDEAIAMLKSGGLYIIDDMLPQSNWPEGHALKVAKLIEELGERDDLSMTNLDWASGVIIAVKR